MIKLTDKEEVTISIALRVYGIKDQFAMAYGECGEFIALSGRAAQGRVAPGDFISEIADVFIMMAQMRKHFGEELVDAEIDYKIDRLNRKLLARLEGNKP